MTTELNQVRLSESRALCKLHRSQVHETVPISNVPEIIQADTWVACSALCHLFPFSLNLARSFSSETLALTALPIF